MSILDRYLTGRLLDQVMQLRGFTRERARLLTAVSGEVLEIGFGTGLNLAHYPPVLRQLTVVDPVEMLPGRVQARIDAAPFRVVRATVSAEQLPYDTARFDCVVSTWTLCTIPDPLAALREARRVLRPGGRLLFVEHGLSDVPAVARWQHRLNPLWRPLAGGCNLNRPIPGLVLEAGFELVELERFLMRKTPRTHGTMFRGCAIPG